MYYTQQADQAALHLLRKCTIVQHASKGQVSNRIQYCIQHVPHASIIAFIGLHQLTMRVLSASVLSGSVGIAERSSSSIAEYMLFDLVGRSKYLQPVV